MTLLLILAAGAAAVYGIIALVRYAIRMDNESWERSEYDR